MELGMVSWALMVNGDGFDIDLRGNDVDGIIILWRWWQG